MKNFLVIFFIFPAFFSQAQIICIFCFDQNDSISQNISNSIVNGSFESHTCIPNSYTNSFCPNSNYYSGNINGWTCTGGGPSTYSNIVDGGFTTIPEGTYGVYFGNGMCNACSPTQFDTSCLVQSSCRVAGVPLGFPVNAFAGYGNALGVSLEQTVTGLSPGQSYVLEFWAGGEGDSTTFFFLDDGIFAVDIGFGNIYFRCKPTLPFPIRTGTRFIIEFSATSASHTVKFTNWGHMCLHCTELILDDVRLYPLAELSPSVPSCSNLPTVDFYSVQNLCPGTCTDFTNLSLNTTSCQWYFAGAIPDTSTDINPSNICYPNAGSYDVQLIATNANGSDTLLLTNYITVYPSPSPQAISQNGDTLFAITGSTSYQWYFNTNIIIGATDYFYVATASGDYNVVATDVNGCEVEAAVFNVLANAQSLVNGQWSLYPNPVSNKLIIQIPIAIGIQVTSETALDISIYNLLGEMVLAVHLPTAYCLLPTCSIDVSNLSSGIYYLEVSAQNIFRNKFVKQ